MAYLVRRLDENTSRKFLHDLFGLKPGSPAWERQKQRFIDGWNARTQVSAQSNRATLPNPENDLEFQNASDTDWTQSKNRAALQAAISQCKLLVCRDSIAG